MARRLVLPLAFCALLLVAWVQSASVKPSPDQQYQRIEHQSLIPPRASGHWPDHWINGADCDTEPPMQVHAYNDDTYFIRQGKCEIFEAPFLYLIFGEDRALLMDTGANPQTPVADIVFEVVDGWLARNGRDEIPLVVAHTHGHFDHIAADSQFNGHPRVEQFVSPGFNPSIAFWGFDDFPHDAQTLDLGGRVLDVLGTPGHHPSSVTLYDRQTQLLLTGDIVYPGHLFVFSANDWPVFVASIERLAEFAATHPVQWVVGCHIEMPSIPGRSYAYGQSVHLFEHVLQFKPTTLAEILEAAYEQDGDPECTKYDEFVIHPVYKCGITWNG